MVWPWLQWSGLAVASFTCGRWCGLQLESASKTDPVGLSWTSTLWFLPRPYRYKLLVQKIKRQRWGTPRTLRSRFFRRSYYNQKTAFTPTPPGKRRFLTFAHTLCPHRSRKSHQKNFACASEAHLTEPQAALTTTADTANKWSTSAALLIIAKAAVHYLYWYRINNNGHYPH